MMLGAQGQGPGSDFSRSIQGEGVVILSECKRSFCKDRGIVRGGWGWGWRRGIGGLTLFL